MHLIEYVLAFVVTLGVLITAHELGHYWVARWSGVRILRFSIGFGRPLWRRTDARGAEWVVAAIPLGGYVRMLDERDGDFTVMAKPGDRPFGALHPAWRIAIALGGPLANFLLAVIAYWALAIAGSTTYMPVLGAIPPESPLDRAGVRSQLEVVSIDGEATASWQQVAMALAARLGDSGEIVIGLRTPGVDDVRERRIPVRDWHRGVDEPDLLGSLGMVPEVPAIIGHIESESPASRAGLRVWDRVTAIDGKPTGNWVAMQEAIVAAQAAGLTLSVERDGEIVELVAEPELRDSGSGKRPFLGIGPPTNTVEYGVFTAAGVALGETADTIGLTLSLLKKMVFGQVSMSNLSGPLTIAQVAGDSARVGWHYFVGVLALLSVSLGVLNLLPIPVLDGGHVIYAGAEWVSGKPVPERIQAMGFQFGMFLVGGLMVLALFNDFARIFGG